MVGSPLRRVTMGRMMTGRAAMMVARVVAGLVMGAWTLAPTAVAQRIASAHAGSVGTLVTLDVDSAPLTTVLQLISSQAGLTPVYRDALIDARTRVTLHVRNIPVVDAFHKALDGTGLVAEVQESGNVAILRASRGQQGGGIIAGTVTDATKHFLRGATVMLDDTVRIARTDENGKYRFSDIPAGQHRVTVRLVGFARQTRLLTVRDEVVVADFTLASSVNTLDQVVVTATGEQRIRELGHVVARINADSLVREAPITSVSELLQARVPGLQVLTGNGGVAGGAIALRLRGQTTSVLDPEPIVIVDGVRYRSNDLISAGGPVQQDQRGPGELRSPLNDLNVNDIASVEVVKGPSASTLYGPDASNGVIIITTKRGHAGKTQFNWYAHPVANEVPSARIARGYQAWGHDPSTGEVVPYNCRLLDQYLFQQCILDSITVAPTTVENPAYSILAKTRPTWQYGANVNGGVPLFRYYLSANYDSQIGSLQLGPAVQRAIADQLGVATLSNMLRNPNTLQTVGTHATITADVTSRVTVDLTVNYTQTNHRNIDASGTFTQQFGYGAPAPGIDTTSIINYGILPSLFLTTTEENANRFTGSANGVVQLFPWLTATASLGVDLGGGATHTILPAGQIDPSDGGYAEDDRRDNMGRTGTLGMTAIAHPGLVSFRTSLGAQYTYTKLDGLSTVGVNLAPGSTSIGTASQVSVSQQWMETVTLGTYGEEVVGFRDRLFVTGSLRLDGATSLGDAYHPHPYPKVGVSWIASDEPMLRDLPGLRSLRFRYSYGAASRYPTSAMKLGSIGGFPQTLGGQSYQRFFRQTLANPILRPERSNESEYGADATILSGIDIGLTWYRRRTMDQLATLNNPTGLPNSWANLGDVAAHGFEATLNVPVVRTHGIQGDVAFAYSYNTDKLVSAGAARQFVQGISGGYRVGYPLDPIFGVSILGVQDTVGGGPDSVIFPNEVVRDSVARFLGVFTPPHTYTLTPTMSVWEGRVRLSALFDRQTGFLLFDNTAATCGNSGLCLAPFLKSTPLLIQARYANGAPENFLEPGDFTRLREVNIAFDIPDRFLRVDILHLRFSHATLSLQGRNLALWTAYKGSDPESHVDASIVGSNANGIPQARAWSFRFDLTP